VEEGRSGLVRFEIEANGFLKQMVRAIIGTFVEVGKGRMNAVEFRRSSSRKREVKQAYGTSHGLFLKE